MSHENSKISNLEGRETNREALEEIRNTSSPTATYYLMNLFAAVVASYGLLENSAAVVIGAMVIAVLLSPIGGVGLALVSRDRKLLLRAGFTLVTGAIEVFVVAFIIGKVHHSIPFSHELLARTQPNLFDLMIALSGGAAGAYAVGRRVPGGTMVGVAIATALVPPIASSAIAASQGSWHLASQAGLLALTNMVAIQCSYSIVLYAIRVDPLEHQKGAFLPILRNMAPSLAMLAVLAIILGIFLENSIVRQQSESQIRASMEDALTAIPGANLGDIVVNSEDSAYDVVASVRTAIPISPNNVRAIEDGIGKSLDKPIKLTVRSILLRVADRKGYLYKQDELKSAIDQPQVVDRPAASSIATMSDSIRLKVAGLLLRDSLREDSIYRDLLKRDSLRIDSLQKNSMVNSIRRDNGKQFRKYR